MMSLSGERHCGTASRPESRGHARLIKQVCTSEAEKYSDISQVHEKKKYGQAQVLGWERQPVCTPQPQSERFFLKKKKKLQRLGFKSVMKGSFISVIKENKLPRGYK